MEVLKDYRYDKHLDGNGPQAADGTQAVWGPMQSSHPLGCEELGLLGCFA